MVHAQEKNAFPFHLFCLREALVTYTVLNNVQTQGTIHPKLSPFLSHYFSGKDVSTRRVKKNQWDPKVLNFAWIMTVFNISLVVVKQNQLS